MKTKVLITSGGTKAPIDPVRDITNMSKGTFGAKLAKEFLNQDHEVEFFSSVDGKTPFSISADVRHWNSNDIIKHVIELAEFSELHESKYIKTDFRNYNDYANGLKRLIKDADERFGSFDMIILAAAVSDYIPKKVSNEKIKSGEDLTIELKPAEKIISKVKEWSPNSCLVGFKLLVGATDDQLFEASVQSIKTNKCDFVIANDLEKLRSGNHELMLVGSHASEIVRSSTSDSNGPKILRKYKSDEVHTLVHDLVKYCEESKS